MSTEAARDFIVRADQDYAIRKMARERFGDIVSVGREHGYDFGRDEFDRVMRERKASQAQGPGGGGSGHGHDHGDTGDTCQCGNDPGGTSDTCQCGSDGGGGTGDTGDTCQCGNDQGGSGDTCQCGSDHDH